MHNEAAYTVEGTYEGKFDCTYRGNSKNRLDFCILCLKDYFTVKFKSNKNQCVSILSYKRFRGAQLGVILLKDTVSF